MRSLSTKRDLVWALDVRNKHVDCKAKAKGLDWMVEDRRLSSEILVEARSLWRGCTRSDRAGEDFPDGLPLATIPKAQRFRLKRSSSTKRYWIGLFRGSTLPLGNSLRAY